ncbi:MAG: hypothetical protein U0401_33865 [Anaerolineae bacterium]
MGIGLLARRHFRRRNNWETLSGHVLSGVGKLPALARLMSPPRSPPIAPSAGGGAGQ